MCVGGGRYNRRTGESRWVAPDTPESVRDRGDPTGPDRAWFSMQAGLGAELRPESPGLTMNAVVFDQRQRPDFQAAPRHGAAETSQKDTLGPSTSTAGCDAASVRSGAAHEA